MTDVLIIGAGPAGLTAAAALATAQLDVLVLDREATAGGIPRHSAHLGFGLRDRRRFQSGPAYAKALVAAAQRAGAQIVTNAMVTGWAGERTVEVCAPNGRTQLTADAIVLATGARERPRAARMIPGDRPSGIYTTGQLQNLVHLHEGKPGTKAVVVGAEAVSWSAVLTLRESGCRAVLMTTEYARPPALGAITLSGRAALRVPVSTRTRITRIIGRGRVSAVEIERDGERREVECDTVVFTADWIPDHELARLGGLDIDAGTLGPLVDPAWKTSRRGVFAIGNLVHPVDTADVAALDGRHVAAEVLSSLLDPAREPRPSVRLRAVAPLRWVTPGLVRPDNATRLSAWIEHPVRRPLLAIEQDGRTVTVQRLGWPAAPGRIMRIPAGVVRALDPARGEATISLRTGD